MKNYDLIIASGATICYNKKASEFSAFKTGGVARYVIYPQNLQSFVCAVKNTTDPLVLGGTTNSLISDYGIEQDLILTTKVKGMQVQNNVLTVACGEKLSDICNFAKKHCLTGVEFLVGIPGTLGGAIFMNAGAFGKCIGEVIKSVTALIDGKIVCLSQSECDFAYRSSFFAKHNAHILQAELILDFTNEFLIANNMKNFKNKRKNAQPNAISLGSTFKKFNGTSAGYYIEKCGLKSYSIGGCEISSKHANFILNKGNACSNDFAKLACFCQKKVYEKFGIQLEREVKYFGKFDGEI